MLIAAFLIGGTSLMISSKTNIDEADEAFSLYASGTLAREAAVVGYNYARQQIMTDNVAVETTSTFTGKTAGGEYTVSIETGDLTSSGSDAYLIVRAEGTVDFGDKTTVHHIYARFEVQHGASGGNSRPPFMEYGLFSEGNINTNGKLTMSVVDGYEGHASIHTNGRVNENGNSRIDGYLTLVNSSDINLSDGINSGTERNLKRAFDPKDPENRNVSLLGPNEPSFEIVERIEGPDPGEIPGFQSGANRIFRNGEGDFQHGGIKNQHYTMGTEENPALWYITSSVNNMQNVNFRGYGIVVVDGMLNINNVHIMQDSEILFYVRSGFNFNGNLIATANNAYAHIITRGGNLPFGQRINIKGSAVVLQGDLNFNNNAHLYFKPVSTAIASRLWDSGDTTRTIELLEYRESSHVD